MKKIPKLHTQNFRYFFAFLDTTFSLWGTSASKKAHAAARNWAVTADVFGNCPAFPYPCCAPVLPPPQPSPLEGAERFVTHYHGRKLPSVMSRISCYLLKYNHCITGNKFLLSHTTTAFSAATASHPVINFAGTSINLSLHNSAFPFYHSQGRHWYFEGNSSAVLFCHPPKFESCFYSCMLFWACC